MPKECAEICSGSVDGEVRAENAVLAAGERQGSWKGQPREGVQLAVIEEHEERKVQIQGQQCPWGRWTLMPGVYEEDWSRESHPPDRTPCPERVVHLRRRSGVRGQVG